MHPDSICISREDKELALQDKRNPFMVLLECAKILTNSHSLENEGMAKQHGP